MSVLRLHCFFVRGHTKNSSDRLFNLLKGGYHKLNIYVYEDMLKVLGKNPQMEVRAMVPSQFMDFTTFFQAYYRKPVSGSITRTHVFTFVREGDTVKLKLQDCRGSEARRQTLVKSKRGESAATRLDALKKLDGLKECNAPGLKDIKAVELFTKWRKFLPKEAQDKTCPKPSDEIMKKFKPGNKKKTAKNKGRKNGEKEDKQSQKKPKKLGGDGVEEDELVRRAWS